MAANRSEERLIYVCQHAHHLLAAHDDAIRLRSIQIFVKYSHRWRQIQPLTLRDVAAIVRLTPDLMPRLHADTIRLVFKSLLLDRRAPSRDMHVFGLSKALTTAPRGTIVDEPLVVLGERDREPEWQYEISAKVVKKK